MSTAKETLNFKEEYENKQEVPHHLLLIFDGTIQGIPCRILKDDGASTNVLSTKFFMRHKDIFVTRPSEVSLLHSSFGLSEMNRKLVDTASVKIGTHEYNSKFVLGDTRYDVILGTPWHKDMKPTTKYDKNEVRINDFVIVGRTCDDRNDSVSHISIRGFRKMLKEKGT